MTAQKPDELEQADEIISDYVKESSFIDTGNLFYAATEYQKAYTALEQKLARAKAALEFYANRDNYDTHPSWGKVCIIDRDTEHDGEINDIIGGKRAREALKELND